MQYRLTGYPHVRLRTYVDEPVQPDVTIPLADLDAWDSFAADNRAALIDAYGSLDAACKRCCDGGLTLGGGAAPLVFIHFED